MTDSEIRQLHVAFGNLSNDSAHRLASSQTAVEFALGDWLFHADADADAFFFIVDGTVSLEIESPGAEPQYVETLGPGQLLGVSWMVPPFKWNWGARARTDVTAHRFEADAVRRAMGLDDRLARAVLEVVVAESIHRLQGTRLRLMDLYRVAEV